MVDASAVTHIVDGVERAVKRGDLDSAEGDCVATQLLCHDAFHADVLRDVEQVVEDRLSSSLAEVFPAFHQAKGRGGSWWPVAAESRSRLNKEVLRAPVSAALRDAVNAVAPPDKIAYDARDMCRPARVPHRSVSTSCAALDAALRGTAWAWCHNGVTQNGKVWFTFDEKSQTRYVTNSFRNQPKTHKWTIMAPDHVHVGDIGGAGPTELFFGEALAGFASKSGKACQAASQ
jgi:hypothetical protein